MWAAKHCSMLFSSGQNRLCVFCCVDKQLADVILGRIPLWVKGFARKSGEPSERLHGETDLAHLHCFKYIVLLDVFSTVLVRKLSSLVLTSHGVLPTGK